MREYIVFPEAECMEFIITICVWHFIPKKYNNESRSQVVLINAYTTHNNKKFSPLQSKPLFLRFSHKREIRESEPFWFHFCTRALSRLNIMAAVKHSRRIQYPRKV